MILPFRHATGQRDTTITSASTPPPEHRRSAERAAELIITRPRCPSTGAGRRFRLELDGRHVADLPYGSTLRLSAYEGSHNLLVRCRPLGTARLAVQLTSHQTLRLQIGVSLLHELTINPENR